jgi:drug/metabolite transporter (DMT)-like permease
MALSENARGALLMMAAMAAFTLNDACMKLLSAELPLFQALFIRGIGTTLALGLIAHRMGVLRFGFSRSDWWLVALRTIAEIAAAFFFLTALFNMPLANVTAILQALPLTVTLAGAVFLGQAVGWRRLMAILIGFCGVLLIVRPGTEGFNTYSLMALTAVGCVTLRDIATRRLSIAVPSVTVALCAAVGVMVFAGFAAMAETWATPSPAGMWQLAGATIFVVGGYLLAVLAMRAGDVGFVSPFRYTGLVWALVLGLAVFDDWPDDLTLLGAAIIVATGLFTFYRERQQARAARRAA